MLHLKIEFSQGKKLRDVLLKEGNLGAMDVVIKKLHMRSLDESKGGGWFTKAYLMQEHHWTKCLIFPYSYGVRCCCEFFWGHILLPKEHNLN